MYGDTLVIRRRADQLRQQGADVRTLADQLVARSEAVAWSGRAAESMRQRIKDRAAHLREAAAAHETAADSLERHLLEVDRVKESISEAERRAASLIHEAQGRVASAEYDSALATDEDRALVAFVPPPSGHADWLDADLPGT